MPRIETQMRLLTLIALAALLPAGEPAKLTIYSFNLPDIKGKMVAFALGKSHPIEFPIPEGITITIEKQTHMVVSGADKGQVGQVAANLRALRPPDPYKQKGVRITGERLKKKAGKAGAKSAA